MPIITPSGGSGAVIGHGFAATLSANTLYNNNDTVKPDSVFLDTDSYYNSATGVATIPAGLGGFYLLSWYLEILTAAVTSVAIKTIVSGAFDNTLVSGGAFANNTHDGSGGVVAYFSAGNAMHGIAQIVGTASATFIGNQTGFGLAYLGSA